MASLVQSVTSTTRLVLSEAQLQELTIILSPRVPQENFFYKPSNT